jgi:hypothetical protein
MMAAGLTLLGCLAFWNQAPPIDGSPEPAWLQDSGERPYVGRRRYADVTIHPDPVEDLMPTGHADEWMWRPPPPAERAHHRWENLGERTRPLRPPDKRTE